MHIGNDSIRLRRRTVDGHCAVGRVIPVTVVVPVLNEAGTVIDLLTGLGRQTTLPAEIVFADAGSSDGTPRLISEWWSSNGWQGTVLKVLVSPGSLPGAGRNRGVSAASQPWIAFIDGGMVPDSNWLEELYATAVRKDAPGVFGVCEFSAERPLALAICAVSNGYRSRYPVIPASLFKREILCGAGRFREDLRTAEDILWVNNYIHRYGDRIVCQDALVHYFDFPTTFKAAFRKWRTSEYNSVLAGVRRVQHGIYVLAPIALLAVASASPIWALSLGATYFVLRGIGDPIRRSKKRYWWESCRSAFWLAPLAVLTVDLAKVLGIVEACFHVAFRSGTGPDAVPEVPRPVADVEQSQAPSNVDARVVNNFGEEWARFPQDRLVEAEWDAIFNDYFHIFPWAGLPRGAVGADVGCGSGRWAAAVAPRVGRLHCVDASNAALDVARTNLQYATNVDFYTADVGNLPFADNELDFAYSLGVLHHVPDTLAALRSIARILKPGGVFLVYLYYAFDNRPFWFRALWNISDALRWGISRLPRSARFIVCDAIAFGVYWPMARMAGILGGIGLEARNFPLAYYRDKSIYVMRTDALDRFGTRLEKRYSRNDMAAMLNASGFCDIEFSPRTPYWCALARKR